MIVFKKLTLLLLIVGVVIASPSAKSDTEKNFSFVNRDKYNVGPLHVYLEDVHCIASPEVSLSRLGTQTQPNVLASKESVSVTVRPSTNPSAECSADGSSRFTVRFVETASTNPERIARVTFTLGKNPIFDIDNQGPGGLSIIDAQQNSHSGNAPSYLIDWQGVTQSRRDVVYNKVGNLETVVQCDSTDRKPCKGTLYITSRNRDKGFFENGKPLVIARQQYKVPFNETKSVALRLTPAGRRLLESPSPKAVGDEAAVTVSAIPAGQSHNIWLGSSNIPTHRAALVGSQYSLKVTNNSSSPVKFCIYQQSKDFNNFPLIWLSSQTEIASGDKTEFNWTTNDYSFFFGEGGIYPGSIIRPSQSVNTMLGTQADFNTIPWPQITNLSPGMPSTLSIRSQGKISDGYVVGVGLSGSLLYINYARSDQTSSFVPVSSIIYLIYGSVCEVGSVINHVVTDNGAAVIDYSEGHFSATAELKITGTWDVQMGNGN